MPAAWLDKAKILVKAGDGGNGAVAFHREKYVAAGGPEIGRASCRERVLPPV